MLLDSQDEYENFILDSDIVYRGLEDEHKLVNVKKTTVKLKKQYYMGSLGKKVKEYIQNCVTCILTTRNQGKKEGFLNLILKQLIPFHTLHADRIGLINETNKHYKHVLVVVYSFTKYTWIFLQKTVDVDKTIKKLEVLF